MRRVEAPRKVISLVPWWWGAYVRSRKGRRGNAGLKEGEDSVSDGSSSAGSTVSIAAAPHLFRLNCGGSATNFLNSCGGHSKSSEGCFSASLQVQPTNKGFVTGMGQCVRSGGSRAKASDSSPQHEFFHTLENLNGSPNVELIQAAAHLVDNLDSWPPDLEAASDKTAFLKPQDVDVVTEHVCERVTADRVISDHAAPPPAHHIRRNGQQALLGATQFPSTDPPASQSLLMFVSSILASPSDRSIRCLKGFDVLEGVVNPLFGSERLLQDTLETHEALGEETTGRAGTINGLPSYFQEE